MPCEGLLLRGTWNRGVTWSPSLPWPPWLGVQMTQEDNSPCALPLASPGITWDLCFLEDLPIAHSYAKHNLQVLINGPFSSSTRVPLSVPATAKATGVPN